MSLQLTPLQQHCLKGIGITPWQYRQAPTQHSLSQERVTSEQAPLATSDRLLAGVEEQAGATTSTCEAVKEPETDYIIPKTLTAQPAHLVKELERALEYVAKHNKAIAWQVHETNTPLDFNEDKLVLPPLEILFNSPSLKKQLWQLLSSPQS